MKHLVIILFVLTGYSCLAQIDEIKELIKDKPKTDRTAQWMCDTAFTFFRNDPAITEKIARLALQKANEWNVDTAKAKANHVIGISFWARDMYDIALTHYIEALKYYEKLDMERGVATINLNIGTIYDDLGDPERGKPYSLRSVELLEEIGDSVNLGRAYNNLGVLFGNIEGQRDSAIYYFEKCMPIRKAMEDYSGVARIYNNIADLYFHKEELMELSIADLNMATNSMELARSFIQEGEDDNLMATIMANTGKVHVLKGNYSLARAYLDTCKSLATKIDSKISMNLYHTYSCLMAQKIGDYEAALRHFEKATEIERELRSSTVSKQIDQLNIQYQTAKKEQELIELEKQTVEERAIRNIIIVTALAIILIIGLLLRNAYLKRKRDKLLHAIKTQKLNDEIEKKNKEISSYTLSFIQKNQLMEELKQQINELKKSSDPETNKQLNRINKIVANTYREEEEWKNFQITFEEMHDSFFTRLKEVYPDLGNAELKLCALIRLNMNLKEAANVLGISPDSVKTARYRLRKKLGLKTEDNLVDFLLAFEREQVAILN